MDSARHLPIPTILPLGRAARWIPWLLAAALAGGPVLGQSQVFYVPMTVEHVRAWAEAIQSLAENDVIHTVISVTATVDETVVYYDHWEDGFEPDITDPLDPVPAGTTQVWGDQDCSNGFTPTLVTCTVDADDVIDAGDILIVESDVPANPRDPSNVFTDPSDKIATSERVTVTMAAWPSTGVQSQLGGAVEVFPTSDWGTAYESPVGEDLVTFVPAVGGAFEFVAFEITSQEDATVVEVDLDGDGTSDQTLNLDEGQVAQVGAAGATDVLVGATVTVTSGEPVQVHLLTANEGTNYEGRWYSLVPTADWDDTYYSPAGTTVAGDDVNIYLYNPNASAIVVRAEQLSGCTDVTVPAGQATEVTLALNTPISAARFVSDGTDCAMAAAASGTFNAVGAIDRNETTHDWGFTLVPETRLTPSAVVGWAPGSNDFSENASPVWVTAVDPPMGGTTIYVDLDGDPATGALSDPEGNSYDFSVSADDLESIRVNDLAAGAGCGGGDCDQTGMRLYTVDGTRITAAWGQDPEFSGSGQPQQLDMGTTVLPFANIASFKEGTLLNDVNNDGGVDIGDSLLYSVRIVNTGIVPIAVTDIFVVDTLDTGTDYIAGTTQIDGVAHPDDTVILPGDTVFPLDADASRTQGLQLQPPPATLQPGDEIVITFQVTVNATAVDPIINQVAVTSGEETFADSSINPLPGASLDIVKTSSGGGSDVQPGQNLTYTVTVTNSSQGNVTGVQLTDPLPAGTSYVATSTSVTGPLQIFVADRFSINRFDNDDGPNDFAGSWDELDVGAPPDSAVAGEVQVIGGELRITNDLGGPAAQVQRGVDLSAAAGGFAILSFDFRYDTGVDPADAIVVEAATSAAGPFTILETFTGLDGDVDVFTSGTRGYDISAFIAAATTVRFRVTNAFGAATEFFYVDDLEIRAVGQGGTAAQDSFSTQTYSGGSGWAGDWVENDLDPGATPQSPTDGNVNVNVDQSLRVSADAGVSGDPNSALRSLDLSGSVAAILEIDIFTSGTLETDDFMDVEVATSAAGPYTLLETFADDFAPTTRRYDITDFISSTTTVRIRVEQNYGGTGEFFALAEIRILAGQQVAVTKDNVPAGANADLLDGVPSALTLPGDSFALAAGESLTATFQVTLDDPLAPTRILNTATVTAHEGPPPAMATVIDPVSKGGAVGDRVWLDVDRDGVEDVGEPGLADVTVELRDGTCTAGVDCPTTTTDAAGNYLFDRLAPGTYTVAVVESTLPGGGAGLTAAPGTLNPSAGISITAEEIFLDVDFGYTVASTAEGVLGDYVWNDDDGDGVQDSGEIGIGGVVVDLVGAGPDGLLGTADDVQVATTSTDPDGSYLFTGVAPAEYLVQLDASNFTGGGALVGFSATSGPQSLGSATSVPVLVNGGDVHTDLDFGYANASLSSITDTVWLDEDSDGVRDLNERLISGVTVDLLDDMGNLLGTATSDADGEFTFTGLADGDYTVVVTDNAGVLIGHEGTTPAALAAQLAVTVSGADVTGVDFGYAAPGELGDVVWSDNDGDGVQDPGEPGIAGVTVDLEVFDSSTSTWDPVTTTTTAADGSYLFEDLGPGSYRAVVTDTGNVLTGYTQTGDPSVPAAPCGASCDAIGQSLVSLNTVDFSLDFGYRNTAAPDVSGTVFEDLDRDGFEDAGEFGIAGVDVALVEAGTDGIFGTNDDLVVAEVRTDANGDYVFPDVQNGDYRVEVRDQEGTLEGYTLTSGLDSIPVTVAGVDVSGVDFGYVRESGTGSIGTHLWLDVDPPGPDGPDGLQGPNEPVLSMVTVRLYRDLDGDGVFEPGGDDGASIATTVTDADGSYLFSGLDAGNYFVDVDETTLPDSTADAVADLTETTYPAGVDPSAVINLSEGEAFEGADFGYRPIAGTAVLGDFVWYDADADGLQDPGEVGIGGVDVDLFGAGPDNMFGTPDDTTFTTTTAADGSYLFTGVLPDDYFLSFDAATLPAGYNTAPTNLPPGEQTYSVTAAAGDVLASLDFGFDGGTTGSIGDRVWLDEDGDGFQNAGEPGVPEVTVNLVGPGPNAIFGDADDEILATTTTDDAGAYDFVGVPAGDYRVEVTDTGGVLDALSLSGGTDPTSTISLAAGQDFDGADFGYAPAAGTGSIGSSIWRDLDFDGILDPGEPPIEGVSVDVWLDVNGNGTIEPGTDNRVRTATSDANGDYEIKALPFGDYVVDVTDTQGVLTGFSRTTGPSPGADDNSQSDPYAVTLSSGSPNNVTADFGYRDDIATGPLSIRGTVFLDQDVDAVFDDPLEPVVQDVEVSLFRITGAGEAVLVGRTTSDVNGDYSFDDLPAGTYRVRVDTTATAAEGFLQTTQTTTGGEQPVVLTVADAVDQDFGFFDGGITTTPVTLSYFETSGDPGRVELTWQTVTEVGHVGFNVLVWRAGGWQRVNSQIVRSSGVDSIDLRSYALELRDVGGSSFLLEDVDIFGRSRFHGPFELGRSYGRRDLAGDPIDWQGIGREHRAHRAERVEAAHRAMRGVAGGHVRVLVDDDGIYRVTYEMLAAAGLELAGADPAAIAVKLRGAGVPARVVAPGVFGPGGFVEFLGHGLDTLYTRTNVYTIGLDATQARRVAVDSSAPQLGAVAPATYRETLRVARERSYSFASPNGDPWFDTSLLAFTSPETAAFDFVTEGRIAGAGLVELTVDLWGVTDWPQAPDHHVVVQVNGLELASETFDGLVDHPVSVTVPESALVSGLNTLEVVVPGDTGVDFDLVNVDGFRVDYPRHFRAVGGGLVFTAAGEVFEVTGLPSPDVVVYRDRAGRPELLADVVVTGVPGDHVARFTGSDDEATYFVAAGAAIRSPRIEPGRVPANLTEGSARLLIISHADFLGGLDRLVQARRLQGWSVRVVDVDDVYGQFSGGVFDPEAIRDYLRFAREHLETEAVLLVGGDTYDYHDHLGLGGVSFIPSLYGRTGDIVRFAPADGLYADVDGDEVPDMSIGRFPVRTAAELEAMVDRTLEYERRAFRRSLLLAADDVDVPSRFDFTQASEQLASLVPPDWQVTRSYVDELGIDGARQVLLERLNEGVAVTSFMGHSGPTTWTFDGLFEADDSADLDNFGSPTVVTQWGCWTTYYVSPFSETLAHKLLLSGDQGAAAVLGATTLTEARSERALGLEIFRRLFEPGATLGGVVLAAKRQLATLEDPAVLDVLIGWNLLGDPTLTGFGSTVDGGLIFADGFESGDRSAWSR